MRPPAQKLPSAKMSKMLVAYGSGRCGDKVVVCNWGTKVCVWKVEVEWGDNDYGGGLESETMTVVNASILKSYNKVIFR